MLCLPEMLLIEIKLSLNKLWINQAIRITYFDRNDEVFVVDITTTLKSLRLSLIMIKQTSLWNIRKCLDWKRKITWGCGFVLINSKIFRMKINNTCLRVVFPYESVTWNSYYIIIIMIRNKLLKLIGHVLNRASLMNSLGCTVEQEDNLTIIMFPVQNMNIEKSMNGSNWKRFWWIRNYMRNLFQIFHIKIRKNLNFRFLLNKTELTQT
jgi:hypothetical protein